MADGPRVAVIGIDCATPQLLFDRLSDELPNISALMQRGMFGDLARAEMFGSSSERRSKSSCGVAQSMPMTATRGPSDGPFRSKWLRRSFDGLGSRAGVKARPAPLGSAGIVPDGGCPPARALRPGGRLGGGGPGPGDRPRPGPRHVVRAAGARRDGVDPVARCADLRPGHGHGPRRPPGRGCGGGRGPSPLPTWP